MAIKKTPIILLLFLFIAASCSNSTTGAGPEPDEPNKNEDNTIKTGTLEVVSSTTGDESLSEEYLVVLDDDESKQIDPNGSVEFEDLEEGSHSVELKELHEQCTIDGDNPVTAEVIAEQLTTVKFDIVCESSPKLTNKIVYTSPGEEGVTYSKIFSMNTDGSQPELLYDSPDAYNSYAPQISPDGTKIVFASGDWDNYIYVMDVDGNNVTQLTSGDDGADDFNPVWSPDGTQIAFERDISDLVYDTEIFVMNADGSNQQNITNNTEYIQTDPAWSPDGDKIVYRQATNDDFTSDEGNLVIADADGNNPQPLTNNESYVDTSPVWSPDGTRIAFTREEPYGYPDIFVINADGTAMEQLTSKPDDTEPMSYNSNDPAWSPDGEHIAFVSSRTDSETGQTKSLIYIIKEDGSGLTALENNTISPGNPTWSPN